VLGAYGGKLQRRKMLADVGGIAKIRAQVLSIVVSAMDYGPNIPSTKAVTGTG